MPMKRKEHSEKERELLKKVRTEYEIHITKNKGYLKSVTKTDYLNHILCIGYSYKF